MNDVVRAVMTRYVFLTICSHSPSPRVRDLPIKHEDSSKDFGSPMGQALPILLSIGGNVRRAISQSNTDHER